MKKSLITGVVVSMLAISTVGAFAATNTQSVESQNKVITTTLSKQATKTAADSDIDAYFEKLNNRMRESSVATQKQVEEGKITEAQAAQAYEKVMFDLKEEGRLYMQSNLKK